jgi:hypothetical protein
MPPLKPLLIESWLPIQARASVGLDAYPLELVSRSRQRVQSSHSKQWSGSGVRSWWRVSARLRTAKGESMLFLTLEDLQGTLDAILFSQCLPRREVSAWIERSTFGDGNHGDGY